MFEEPHRWALAWLLLGARHNSGMDAVVTALSWVAALGFPLVLGYALYVHWARRRMARVIENHACKLCGQSFAEALVEVQGRPTAADRARLDRFQVRYARWRVVCHECGGINICTVKGEPYVALVERS
jgi:hypothetical protein